jgi:hypothetical protein
MTDIWVSLPLDTDIICLNFPAFCSLIGNALCYEIQWTQSYYLFILIEEGHVKLNHIGYDVNFRLSIFLNGDSLAIIKVSGF